MNPTEILSKHFKDVKSASIPPVRMDTSMGIDSATLIQGLNKYWEFKGQDQFSAYQAGQIIATSNQKTTFDLVLLDIAKIIEEGIRTANLKRGISSENLKDHFILLSQSMKVIASDLNAFTARNAHDNAQTMTFDYQELLAILSGYITSKIYAQR